MCQLRLLSRTTTPTIQAAPISKNSGIRNTNYERNLYRSALATMCGLSVHADEAFGKNTNSTSAGLSESYAGRLGAGIIIGEPIGGSLKYWFNDTLAIDGAVGWSSPTRICMCTATFCGISSIYFRYHAVVCRFTLVLAA
jgi:hypothetical protein